MSAIAWSAKGVTWKVGRLFHGDREVYNFDLLQQAGHKMPAFINLQQYHVEQYLVERCADFPDLIDLRWKNKVTGIEQDEDTVSLEVSTPDGDYELKARLRGCMRWRPLAGAVDAGTVL